MLQRHPKSTNHILHPIFLLLLVSLFATTCSSTDSIGDSVSISGNVSGLGNARVQLAKLNLDNNETIYLDTVFAKDGRFEFSLPVQSTYLHSLILGDSVKFPFFLEQSDVSIEGHLDAGSFELTNINSGPEDNLFRSFDIDALFEQETGSQIMRNYPDRVFAAFVAFYQFQLYNIPGDTLKLIMESFSPTVKASEYYKHLTPLYETLLSTAIGSQAPLFSAPDANGVMRSPEEFRGKYLLLDFWASWCAPCRQENPTWVAFYKQTDRSKFEMMGISVDHNSENWKKAIQSDGLNWVNVSTTSGWDSISVMYAVRAVPQNYLLDPEGKIVAKNISSERLLEWLDKDQH